MGIVQQREERPAGRVGARIGRTLAVLLWLAVNLALGVATAYPLGYGATLLAYLADESGAVGHPYLTVLGRVSRFTFPRDEVTIVAAGILFGLILVLAFFGAVNVGLRALLRRWPAWAYWPATVLLLLLPSLWFWR